MLVGEAFYLLNDVSRQHCHAVESTLSTAQNLPFFVSDKINDESELICKFVDGKSTFNEKHDKHFIVDERTKNNLAKAISPIAIEHQISSLKSSIIKILSNKKTNTSLFGNLPTQLNDIFALFERNLFKNGLQSLYNAAVSNAKGNDHCVKGIERSDSSNFHLLEKLQQPGNKITNETKKENVEKFGFGRGQKRSKRRAPRNNGGSPFNALTILLLIVSGFRLARAAADNFGPAAPPPNPLLDPAGENVFIVFIFLPVIVFVAMFAFYCCRGCCCQPSLRYLERVEARRIERAWLRERQQRQLPLPLQRLPTFRTTPSTPAMDHPNQARLLPSNIALSDALANLAEQTNKTDKSAEQQIRTQSLENVPNDCSICLSALEPSASV